MSTIRRVNRPADQFTMVRNSFARDGSLSFHARGVGLWLLSHAEGFETTTQGMASMAGVGRDQVRRALTELETARYLRRTRDRSPEGKLGLMVYEIQCEPFPPETPRSNQRLENQALGSQGLAGARHKKNTSKKITTKNLNPSGGASADAADIAPQPVLVQDEGPATEEDPMAKASEPPTLFDVKAAPRPVRSSDAQSVVAAYVDSFRANHAGVEPLRADVGRVARDAAALLNGRSGATAVELLAAATALGAGRYANLGMQLKITRDQSGRKPGNVQGMARAVPHGAEVWRTGAEVTAAAAAALIAADPAVAAFMAGVA